MPSPCGIHIYKKARAFCPICERVLGEISDTCDATAMTAKARADRREAGKRSRSNMSQGKMFGRRYLPPLPDKE